MVELVDLGFVSDHYYAVHDLRQTRPKYMVVVCDLLLIQPSLILLLLRLGVVELLLPAFSDDARAD